MRVSHESIYHDVYRPSRKAFDASMFHRLRSDRSIRRPLRKRSSYGRGQIRNTVSIRQRPVEVTLGKWLGIGRVTSCSERVRQRWQPWWIAPPVTRWSSRCPTGAKADAVARAWIAQMGARLQPTVTIRITGAAGRRAAEHIRLALDLASR
jgi:hypothetical protein